MQAGIRFWPFQAKRPGLVSPGPASTSIKKRAIGFEPTTSSLGSWHSTTELRPQTRFSTTCFRQALLQLAGERTENRILAECTTCPRAGQTSGSEYPSSPSRRTRESAGTSRFATRRPARLLGTASESTRRAANRKLAWRTTDGSPNTLRTVRNGLIQDQPPMMHAQGHVCQGSSQSKLSCGCVTLQAACWWAGRVAQ